MTRRLRQRHRAAVCALAILLPLAFAGGLAARRSVPVLPSAPAGLENSGSRFDTTAWSRTDLWPARKAVTALRRDSGGSLAVELTVPDLTGPDVLVYWAPATEAARARLPAGARLLGVLAGRAPLPVPEGLRGTSGYLLLYSLADHEILA